MESEIELAEKNFKIIADSAPFSLWISGKDKKCFYFNKSWLDFTGRTMEQELGNGWAEGVHPDDLENCISVYISHFNEKSPFKMEYRLRRYDGLYRWVLDTGHPRYAPSGDFLGFVGSCIDVTDMWFAHHEMVSYTKQQEELVGCSNKLMDTLYDSKQSVPQSPQSLNYNDDNSNNSISNNSDDFINMVLKSASVSLNSSSVVLFKINPNNRFEMNVEAVYNNEYGSVPDDVKKLSTFTLPNDFWDTYNGSNGSFAFFSILFHKYFTPYLQSFGIKSISATHISSFNEKFYGFVVVGSTIEREYSPIEQNTLISMANLLGVYIGKNEEAKVSQFKDLISSSISKSSDNPILTVDRSGSVVDMNPKAVKVLLPSNSSGQASVSQLSSINIMSVFPFLKDLPSSSFYTAVQTNYFSNKNRYFKEDSDRFFETSCITSDASNNKEINLPIQILIKEISSEKDDDQLIFLFILKDLSLIKKLEEQEKTIKEQKKLIEELEKLKLKYESQNPIQFEKEKIDDNNVVKKLEK
ncbi:hypothetical protein DICPUDRAFT_149503 [Dictyostelium purpureum]|uniref:histidine kinase n=1 Tax=Dictyostelium purpureum TaxID=5786 RepID=F0ZDW9_DICPU|nr:uncharacterized protein DICPUDRAFT_149503 [Dictyostelium purpureum]EGC37873.1 hypothetical protein DICPUDRAFT_149503 [Dictyostelium purpureum]|eukprot:XP_003285623.1 hypothetical protein DICPUDRAFT_149503 [Dictyostelium purpureum]